MYDFIEGEIVAKEPQKLIVKSAGIGFALKVSTQTLSNLPPAGSVVTVYTYLQWREDEVSIYGFSNKEERTFFELLIQVSGVGPKLALAVLSALPTARLTTALVTGDLAALTCVSGVGKKTAQRMILELKEKLDSGLIFGGGNGDAGGAGDSYGGFSALRSEEAAQAVAALEALGYTRSEITKAFAGSDLGAMDAESIIRLGLKKIAQY